MSSPVFPHAVESKLIFTVFVDFLSPLRAKRVLGLPSQDLIKVVRISLTYVVYNKIIKMY